MTERISRICDRADAEFRNPDGILAVGAKLISPEVGESYLRHWQKRVLDVVAGAALAVPAAPLIVVSAIAKTIEDGHEPFLAQARLKNGAETFPVVKIRTMIKHAEKMDSVAISEGKNHYEDPRSTNVGVFLRKFHLDELTQVFQILLDQMSVVGNRPILPKYAEHLANRWSEARYRDWIGNYGKGKPGLTGAYQVFGPDKRHDEKRYHWDMFYTRNASLGFDLYILWKTVGRVLRG